MPRKKVVITAEEPVEVKEETVEKSDAGSEKVAAAAGGYDVREDEVVEKLGEEEKPQEAESTPSEKPEHEEEPEDFSFLNKKPESRSSSRIFWLAVVVLLLVVAVVGGVLVFKDKVNFGPGPTPEPTTEVTPTSEPTLIPDRSELKIQILNGSGAPGTAGKAKEFLEELGYEVADTGNAKNYDYEETEISLKESRMDFKALLVEDLGKEYEISEDVGTLDEDSDYDAVVIIGEKK